MKKISDFFKITNIINRSFFSNTKKQETNSKENNNNELIIGEYSFDLKKIVRYLEQDMKDDWFKDPLLYEDKFDKKEIKEYFDENVNKNSGVYLPKKRVLLNIPKKQGTLRYALETNFFDRIAYHTFGLILIENLDPLVSCRVLSHRFVKNDYKNKRNRYLFYNSIEQWKKFEEYIKIDADDKCLLFTDIQNYFENINLTKLTKILKDNLKFLEVEETKLPQINYCIDSIMKSLIEWSYNGESGLPQNRDISSFLANMYMKPIDDKLINEGFDYYRYMDDIRIICKDKFEARKALKILCHELRKLNLTLNGKKTEILENGSDSYINFTKNNSLDLERIDAMYKSKKKSIVALAFKDTKEGIEECIEKNDFESREFRFYVNRISKIALCKDIEKPDDYFDLIKDKIFDAIIDFPVNTDYLYNLLISVDLNKSEIVKIKNYIVDSCKSIYSWQNYLLWKVLIMQDQFDPIFLEKAIEILKTDERDAMICGALLYVGKNGSNEHRKLILKSINKDDSFMVQRHKIIAIQKLKYFEIKSKENLIFKENKNCYRKLKQKNGDQYLVLPKEIKYYDLIKEVGFYV